jgi:hypothetical protein
VRVATVEVGEERDERCVVDAFVGGESRAVEPLPARIRHVIDEENAVEHERPACPLLVLANRENAPAASCRLVARH